MCDAEGCCHGCVLGSTEATEVHSGDYEIRIADMALGKGSFVHGLIFGRNFSAGGGEGKDWWKGLEGREGRADFYK